MPELRLVVLPALFFSCMVVGAAWAEGGAGSGMREWRLVREDVLGTSASLVVRAARRVDAERLEARVFERVALLADILSSHDPDSELQRLAAAGEPLAISRDLGTVLRACDRWRRRSKGVLHPGVQLLAQRWRRAEEEGRPPTDEELLQLVEELRGQSWILDDEKGTAALDPALPVSLDALAKGYIIDQASTMIDSAAPGARVQILEIGGDLRVRTREEKVITVADPRAPAEGSPPLCRILVEARAVATSGGYARGFVVGEQHFSHILDPRTGRPAGGVLGATVVARDCLDADALATIACVLTPAEGIALVKAIPGAECVLVDAGGEIHATPGWARLVQIEEEGDEGGLAREWATGFELAIEFEVQRPAASGRRRGGYRRPYLAVWLEDADGKPVRTLCLWIEKVKWLRDLRRWSRHHGDEREFVGTVSRATRRPGAYELVCDGLDDYGMPLPRGSYTVFIEVAREHGTYQLMRHEVTIDEAPFAHDLEGNLEVASARVSFRKRTSK